MQARAKQQTGLDFKHSRIEIMADSLLQTIEAAKKVVLSVGSGDGSQQASIVKLGHSNVVTTFYDSEATVYAKYPKARQHIEYLKGRSAGSVLFQVDATNLHSHPELKTKKFDIILFTFPHTGIPNFNPASIDSNKCLIRRFLRSAQQLVQKDGEIIMTLKTSAPYDKWTFPDLSRYELEMSGQHAFHANAFPGYIHRPTERIGKTAVKNGAAKTFVFTKKRKHEDKEDEKEKEENSGDPMVGCSFCPSENFSLAVQFVQATDEDISDLVLDILKVNVASKEPRAMMTALDIRRLLPEAMRPDTRQLNRVLYKMESKGIVFKGPPRSGVNNKPTWRHLAEVVKHT